MSPQLKLFGIRVGENILPDVHFSGKREAKAYRDKQRVTGQRADVHVTYGPDHWKRKEGDGYGYTKDH